MNRNARLRKKRLERRAPLGLVAIKRWLPKNFDIRLELESLHDEILALRTKDPKARFAILVAFEEADGLRLTGKAITFLDTTFVMCVKHASLIEIEGQGMRNENPKDGPPQEIVFALTQEVQHENYLKFYEENYGPEARAALEEKLKEDPDYFDPRKIAMRQATAHHRESGSENFREFRRSPR